LIYNDHFIHYQSQAQPGNPDAGSPENPDAGLPENPDAGSPTTFCDVKSTLKMDGMDFTMDFSYDPQSGTVLDWDADVATPLEDAFFSVLPEESTLLPDSECLDSWTFKSVKARSVLPSSSVTSDSALAYYSISGSDVRFRTKGKVDCSCAKSEVKAEMDALKSATMDAIVTKTYEIQDILAAELVLPDSWSFIQLTFHDDLGAGLNNETDTTAELNNATDIGSGPIMDSSMGETQHNETEVGSGPIDYLGTPAVYKNESDIGSGPIIDPSYGVQSNETDIGSGPTSAQGISGVSINETCTSEISYTTNRLSHQVSYAYDIEKVNLGDITTSIDEVVLKEIESLVLKSVPRVMKDFPCIYNITYDSFEIVDAYAMSGVNGNSTIAGATVGHNEITLNVTVDHDCTCTDDVYEKFGAKVAKKVRKKEGDVQDALSKEFEDGSSFWNITFDFN